MPIINRVKIVLHGNFTRKKNYSHKNQSISFQLIAKPKKYVERWYFFFLINFLYLPLLLFLLQVELFGFALKFRSHFKPLDADIWVCPILVIECCMFLPDIEMAHLGGLQQTI